MTKDRVVRESGFTFIELIIAVVIMVLATSVLITHLAINYAQLRKQRDKVHAFMTAKSILSEIQAYAAAGEGGTDVDVLDDGASTNPALTIAQVNNALVKPDHELSGNSTLAGRWVWSRQITVRPLQGLDNRKLRYASVKIFKRDKNGVNHEIASLSSVINTLSQSFPTTQVFDIYMLAIENIPGWWVHMESIRPFMEAMVSDLERSNSGLSIRTHWITKASYGRNEVYRPYINRGVDSHAAPAGTYYYPGLMPAGSASTNYYVPGAIKARMLTEKGELNGYDKDLNPHPYALADFFNHGMRLPRERALHQRRIAAVQQRKAEREAARVAGKPLPPPLWDMSEEPTYRLLLEDMCTASQKYQNALLINLHGELVPMPSIRNYSDPAKSPLDAPGVRVVTHAEELRTRRDATGAVHDAAVFRVYAYTMDPATYSGPKLLGPAKPILLQVMGVNLARPDGRLVAGVTLQSLRGGVSVGGTSRYFGFANAKAYTDPLLLDEMHYRAYFIDPGPGEEKYTLISLRNTPVVAPPVWNALLGGYQGLVDSTAARLYGMEYVPACTGAKLDFSHNLADGGKGPKNTARWTLRIAGSILESKRFVTPGGVNYQPGDDVMLTVRTRIHSTAMGPWAGTGTMFPVANEPENLSETYTWWADSVEDVPFTERSQFLGDPRHSPYKDVCHGDPDFPDGYNWCFDSLQNTIDVTGNFPGLDRNRLRDRWQGYLRQDVGRYFELLRTALVRSGSVYTTLTGWSYYYMGHGAEIGYDAANGYPSSIPTNLTAFGSSGQKGFVNNITGSRKYVRSSAKDYWWGMPWLGELCPDSHYKSQWLALDPWGKAYGNLVPGTGTDRFYQADDASVYSGSSRVTAGTALLSAVQRLKPTGCGMFFNTGTSTSTFNHAGSAGTGDLIGAGLELAANYNMELPATTKINRPFALSVSNSPDGWDLAPYAKRFNASLVHAYYSSSKSGYTGSGLIELAAPDGSASAFVVANGLSETTQLGAGALARYSLLTLVHSFFEAGSTSIGNRILMPPRVELIYPTEVTEIMAPASIDLRWDIAWRRWDRDRYTGATPDTFAETDGDIDYHLIYSRDNGRSWQSVLTDAVVVLGQPPADPAELLADFSTGPETHTWPTPVAKFPAGTYLVQVAAYRRGQALHYAYHQRRVFIDR